MNEQLQQALAVILSKSTDAVVAGVSFLQAEIPDVIRQLLLWKLVSYSLIGGFIVVAAIAWFWVGAKLAMKWHDDSDGVVWVPFGFGSFFVAVLAVPYAGSRLLYALQIVIAPKVYLIEYAASLAAK